MHGSYILIIDITGLRDGSASSTVAAQLLHASQTSGFLYVAGHGIADAVIDRARTAARAFFHAENACKEQVRVSTTHRGWLGPDAACMDDDLAADLKESFIWGWQDAHGSCPEDHPLRGANRWPLAQPELQVAAMAWFEEADRVARHLLRGFALGLGLPPESFLYHSSRPLSRASFVHYPPTLPGDDQSRFGVGPHTDFGVLTVLCQDDVGGLEVRTPSGVWIAAPPVEGTLVVNVADLLQRWTAGRCRSTPHRVINRSRRDRLSLVLAFDPEPHTVIDSRVLFGAGAEPEDLFGAGAEPEDLFGAGAEPENLFGAESYPHEAPITCGDWLEQRFARAFAYRQAAR